MSSPDSPEGISFETLLTAYTEALRRGEDVSDLEVQLEGSRQRLAALDPSLDVEFMHVMMLCCAIDAGAEAEASRVYDLLRPETRATVDEVESEPQWARQIKIWKH